MNYLVELDALNGAGQPETLRYSDHGLTTRPNDAPPNTAYDPYVRDPGNIERHLFSDGRTFGDLSVGVGVTRLVNVDGSLDYLRNYAFDGRAIRIYALASIDAPFGTRRLLLEGTIAQTEFQDSDFSITVRDWLEALRSPLQTLVYAGSTTTGGMGEAEGGEDLKDKTKPMLFGGPMRGIPVVLANAFDLVYDVSAGAIAAVHGVFDQNVALQFSADYPTVAALVSAVHTPGQYATCLAFGKVRLFSNPVGLVTVDASEGATVAARTAGQIVRRMLLKAGMVDGTDFYSADCAALDAVAPYECAVWFGPDGARPTIDQPGQKQTGTTTLAAISFVLGSVRGSISPDFSGAYRVRQFAAPVAARAKGTIDESETPGLDELDIDAPGDQSNGLPTKRVTIRYGQNLAVAGSNDVNVNTTPERRAFATQEWRQTAAASATTAQRHHLAHEMVRDTALVRLADAQHEADAVLALYSTTRIVLRDKIPTAAIGDYDLSDVVMFRADRFGLEDGRPFIVIGRTDEFEPGHTTLTLWG